MTSGVRVGVLGGTFDPIHRGHLAAARAATDALHLDQVRFIPSARPPHRPDEPQVSAADRREMVARAVADEPSWQVSDLELRRDGPSYTLDTLHALHAEGLAPSQIFFLIGADAFAEIATWHRYPAMLDAAHFVVMTRPGFSLDALRARVPARVSQALRPAEDADTTHPSIILVAAETPDVSSTEVRRRLRAGESISECVPEAVAAYIRDRKLYRQESPAGR